jgi:hypothetical protein
MTINQITQNIIKQYSFKDSKGYITYDIYNKLNQEELNIIKQNLNLKQEYLKYMECFGCDEELPVRIKENKTRFIHCFANECGIYRKLKNNEDLAYILTLNGIADFLINLLEITGNKTNSIAGKIIELGKKQIFDLDFNIYLLKERLNSQEIFDSCKPKSKKAPSIIIKLTDKDLKIDQVNIADCWFNDLIFYNDSLNKFSINYKVLTQTISGCFEGSQKTTIQKFLNEKCLEWFKELISKNIIKRGEKEKYKKEANNLFNISTKAFDKIWKDNAPDQIKKGGRIAIKNQ